MVTQTPTRQLKTHTLDDSRVVIESPTPVYSDNLPVPRDIRHVNEFVEFARWYALPRSEREVQTQKDFAENIGLSQDTLTDWKKRDDFRYLVREFIRDWMQEHIPDVVEGLYGRIVGGEGGANDVKLFIALSEGNPPPLK